MKAAHVCLWHEAAVRRVQNYVRFLRYSSREMLAVRLSYFGPKQTSHGALVVLASAKSQTNAIEPDTVELRCPRLTCFHRQCARQRPARHDFTSRERQSVRIAR